MGDRTYTIHRLTGLGVWDSLPSSHKAAEKPGSVSRSAIAGRRGARPAILGLEHPLRHDITTTAHRLTWLARLALLAQRYSAGGQARRWSRKASASSW